MSSILSLSLVLLSAIAFSQPPAVLENASDRLGFMLGEWQGQGYRMDRTGKQYTDVHESVECKLDCRVLEVNGLGTITDPETGEVTVVHDAFGVVFIDPADNELKIRAYTKYGIAESNIEFLEDKVFRWRLDTPGGQVRYTINFSKEGRWIEKGEFSRDGEQWMEMMGMELVKG